MKKWRNVYAHRKYQRDQSVAGAIRKKDENEKSSSRSWESEKDSVVNRDWGAKEYQRMDENLWKERMKDEKWETEFPVSQVRELWIMFFLYLNSASDLPNAVTERIKIPSFPIFCCQLRVREFLVSVSLSFPSEKEKSVKIVFPVINYSSFTKVIRRRRQRRRLTPISIPKPP